MEKFFSKMDISWSAYKAPILTVMANICFGLAFGRILVTSGVELPGNYFIKIFMIIGTCLLFSYLAYVRKTARLIYRDLQGRVRPLFKEMVLCAALNSFMFLLSVSLFVLKSQV